MATTIKIGHAFGSNETVAGSKPGTNGKPGEQRGLEEVGINPNYYIGSQDYNLVLRPKSRALAELSAIACEDGCKNSNIGYGQNDRNTLEHEAYKVGFDLSKITTPCNCDCASFMTVCAMAGGAKIKHEENAPWCQVMREWFCYYGYYEAIDDRLLVSCTDYLRRGDILVDEDSHTLMILEDGCKILENETVKIKLSLEDISSTKADIKVNLLKIEEGEELPAISAKTATEDFSWKYELSTVVPAIKVTKTDKVSFTDNSAEASINLSSLTPGTAYCLTVISTKPKSSKKIHSARLFFYTTPFELQPVSNLKVTLSSKFPEDDRCTITFDSYRSSLSKYKIKYRVILCVNSKMVGYDDNLIVAGDTKSSFLLSKLAGNGLYKPGDFIQIGVMPIAVDAAGEVVLADANTLVYSKPIYIKYNFPVVYKIFIKIKNKFKSAVLHQHS